MRERQSSPNAVQAAGRKGDDEPFRKVLAGASFYVQRKEMLGSTAWDLLEKVTGKLGWRGRPTAV